jgi:small-conductance mechanosensitive channel
VNWFDSRHLTVGGASVSYAALLVALLVVTAGFLLASKLSSRIRRFGESAAGGRWHAAVAQLAGYALRFAAVAVGLQITGIDVASVLAAGAVLAVGIGIAMQKVAENFVSGIILFAERSIREGDIIEFEGRIAKVLHMGIRATIALTLDDEEIIGPNSVLAQSAVKNLTLTDNLHRLRVNIGVAYATDLDRARDVLSAAANDVSWREKERAPVVLLLEFGSSSVDFEVSVWTRDVWGLRRGQSELRRTLWRALRDAGITIPFPQLDVHFDAATPVTSRPAGRASTP